MKKKQHPLIGKYMAQYECSETDDAGLAYVAGRMYDTPEDALNARVDENLDDGDVIYVYALVGVKVVRKPTLTENLPA